MDKETTKIGVYGSLLSGLGNHGLLRYEMDTGNARLIGNDKIKGFKLYAISSFPGIKRSESEESEVKVEVCEVNNRALDSVRSLEGYNPYIDKNNFYDEIQTQTEDHGEISVYLYMPTVRPENLVEHGDWREFRGKRY